jgi:hypothetical protein
MGTDVYMTYVGQPENDSWEEGYIRASIGMINENYILRQIFPEQVWEDEVYEFHYNMELLEKVQRLKDQYLHAIKNNYDLGSKEEAGVKHGDGVQNLFKNMGFGTMQTSGSPKDMDSAKGWFRQVEHHVVLGIAMSNLGKKPRVEISW